MKDFILSSLDIKWTVDIPRVGMWTEIFMSNNSKINDVLLFQF